MQGMLFPTRPPSSQAPASSPTIQHDSDTFFLEIASGPKVRGSVLHDCPLPRLPDPWVSGIPTTPSWGLINLLQWLTELRETFYLLAHQFLIEIYTLLRNSHCKRCTGQDVWEGAENTSMSCTRCSPTWTFSRAFSLRTRHTCMVDSSLATSD